MLLPTLLFASADPPTLDELLEDAEVEDRRRIQAVLFDAHHTISDVLALETELGVRAELLAPPAMRDALALRVHGRYASSSVEEARANAFEVMAVLSLDLDRIMSVMWSGAEPAPRAAEARNALCLALLGQVPRVASSALEQSANRARAAALDCPGARP